MKKLTMLGTGHAMVKKCYNTCFVLQDETFTLLVDAGGGNTILNRLDEANVDLSQVDAFFITHTHTDHILGAVWVMRALVMSQRTQPLPVYGHDEVIKTLQLILSHTFTPGMYQALMQKVVFCEVTDGEKVYHRDHELQFFDIHSSKTKQFGFKLTFPDGETLSCLGDEPYQPVNHEVVVHSDWLMCEAFCLYRDREIYHPYQIHHSTAKDAGTLAEQLGVSHLVLYHTEDTQLANRKALYTDEAKQVFSGKVYVPDDMESIEW